MNKKGTKTLLGFALLTVLFVFILALFSTIEPLKENLDVVRDGTALNCRGTDGFNQADYDDDSELEKLVRRPTCFVTGLTMVYFVGAFIIAGFTWVITNWRKLK